MAKSPTRKSFSIDFYMTYCHLCAEPLLWLHTGCTQRGGWENNRIPTELNPTTQAEGPKREGQDGRSKRLTTGAQSDPAVWTPWTGENYSGAHRM